MSPKAEQYPYRIAPHQALRFFAELWRYSPRIPAVYCARNADPRSSAGEGRGGGGGMLKQARRDYIVEALRQNGGVLASELAGQLGISDNTVRRDLSELADAGVLQRVHGRAVPMSPALASFAA